MEFYYWRKSRLAYYGYDLRDSYGSYSEANSMQYRSLVKQFNATLRVAYALEREGKIKVLEVRNDEIEARYFLYWDDNSNQTHSRLCNFGGGLGRGIFVENDNHCLPNRINGLKSKDAFDQYKKRANDWQERLPLKRAEELRKKIIYFSSDEFRKAVEHFSE